MPQPLTGKRTIGRCPLMNIVFLPVGGTEWTAGRTTINNLLYALQYSYPADVTRTFFVDKGCLKSTYSHILPYISHVVEYSTANGRVQRSFVPKAARLLSVNRDPRKGYRERVNKRFHDANVDVVYSSCHDPSSCRLLSVK